VIVVTGAVPQIPAGEALSPVFCVQVFPVPAVPVPVEASLQSKFPAPVTPAAEFSVNVFPVDPESAAIPNCAAPVLVFCETEIPEVPVSEIPLEPPVIVFPLIETVPCGTAWNADTPMSFPDSVFCDTVTPFRSLKRRMPVDPPPDV
jgi:hypothetical protein